MNITLTRAPSDSARQPILNPLQRLHGLGQSVWLDYIRRSLLTSGELERLILVDGLRGVTSNPAIFEKAIAGSSDYAEALAASELTEPMAIYESLAIEDIQRAADILRRVYTSSDRRDGYVSLEVSPSIAHDTALTVSEAKRLWAQVDRPNVMIKIPATPAGIPAIREVVGAGININVTLLFSVNAYEQVAQAYLAGLETFSARGGDLHGVASVASFFISRIDAAVDAQLEAKIKTAPSAPEAARLTGLLGKIAIANAKVAYDRFQHLFSGYRWQSLAHKGAQPQRLLWASTGIKNPQYRDTRYVEELIGQNTVNTVPPVTYDAFRDHGLARPSLTEGAGEAPFVLQALRDVGIDFSEVTDRLLAEGLAQFVDAFTKLLAAVEKSSKASGGDHLVKRLSYRLPSELGVAVAAKLAEWAQSDVGRRLWARDASLWTDNDESHWLGWLGITDAQRDQVNHFAQFAAEVKRDGFKEILLLGMGGSSLCPEVLRTTFRQIAGFPDLRVLDSTDPSQITQFISGVNFNKTLCIVSSKSGGTLEPNIFKQYFFKEARSAVGERKVGSHFVAITDPGSHMQSVAEGDGFRHVFFGMKSIGGRYSALSDFGMIPAAAMGIDVTKFLDRAEAMVHACAATVPVTENPGAILGAILGTCAEKFGRDKLTFAISSGIRGLGPWLEQLVAESTGKEGKGLIPIDGEELAGPETYGNDRIFVQIREAGTEDAAQNAALAELEAVGHPVVRIQVEDGYDLGQQFFLWEVATALAGSVLRINAFNQPDVEASKIATRQLTNEYEETGRLAPEAPLLKEGSIEIYTDEKNRAALLSAIRGHDPTLNNVMRAHLKRLGPGDYFGLLAYIEMNKPHTAALQSIRMRVRNLKKVATCLGFGPRFLHSTGQAYKGGPNSGVFLQVTCDDEIDVPVPGQKYTFGVVKAAQARGDFKVLADRGRRALRVHLGKDVSADLEVLARIIEEAIA